MGVFTFEKNRLDLEPVSVEVRTKIAEINQSINQSSNINLSTTMVELHVFFETVINPGPCTVAPSRLLILPTPPPPLVTPLHQILDDVEPPRRLARENDEGQEGDARTAYLQPSLKAQPIARPELERDHQANIDFERYRGRV